MSFDVPPASVLDEMHPFNHKTIFLMDHSINFSCSCESLEVDLNNRAGFIPLAPIDKSLWTCSVEAVLEYCRIVWELFPSDKLIRIIIADHYATNLNTWLQSEQNLCHILERFANTGPPCSSIQQQHDDGNELFKFSGLISSVQAMCECSEIQHAKRTSLNENKIPIVNRCRLIYITSFNSNDINRIIEDRLDEAITRGNVNAVASDLLIRIDACHLVIINVHQTDSSSVQLDNISKHRVSSILESETFNVKASVELADKLITLLLCHYNLLSSTVTGIPMKEGKHANSSLSYNVELFHAAELHDSLFKGSSIDINSFMIPKEGFQYSTVSLKWYGPRNCVVNEIKAFNSIVHRVTPVDINSRPSQCLINFLLSGKAVMLEVPRRGGKALSHLLSAQAGQLYMHSLIIGRSILGNSPSISEGAGGRVIDYRITDFGQFMQNNRLYPLKIGKIKSVTVRQRTRAKLEQHTKFWPMTFSSTTIFNYKKNLDPILNLMVESKLKESDVIKCKKCIYSLVDYESYETGQRTKTSPKKEEQWNQMWNELETFLRDHCVTDKHIDVLNCFLDVKCKDFTSDKDKSEFDDALKELEQLSKEYDEHLNETKNQTIPSTCTQSDGTISPLRKTVLELWMDQCGKIKQRPEFAGYSTATLTPSGNLKVKLYASMNKSSNYRKR